MARPQVLIFDVNETLLDLAELRSVLAAALGGDEPLAAWFFRLLHGSLVANATDSFRSFETIGVEALRAVSLRQGAELSEAQAKELVADRYRRKVASTCRACDLVASVCGGPSSVVWAQRMLTRRSQRYNGRPKP